jgi:tetratricopeptide (TPR) repeat protein
MSATCRGLVLILLLPFAARATPPEAQEAFERARGLEGEVRLVELRRAVALDPDFGEAVVELVIAEGDAADALPSAVERLARRRAILPLAERATVLLPRSTDAWDALGWLLRAIGDKLGAADAFCRLARLEPLRDMAWTDCANLWVDAGQPARAVAVIEEWARVVPKDVAPLFGLAGLMKRLGQPEGALAAYDRLLQREPDQGTALLDKAILLARMGRWTESERVWVLPDTDMDSQWAWYGRGLCRAKHGDAAGALAWRRRLEGAGHHALAAALDAYIVAPDKPFQWPPLPPRR